MKDIRKRPEHYQNLYANSESRREQIRASRKKRILRFRRIVDAYKVSIGCVDCGYEKYAVALDFGHREPDKKSRNISAMIRSMTSLPILFEEIFKCDIRCSNCYRIRHHKKFDSLAIY